MPVSMRAQPPSDKNGWPAPVAQTCPAVGGAARALAVCLPSGVSSPTLGPVSSAKRPKACPSCGAKNTVEAKRCASCGATLETPPATERGAESRRYRPEGFSPLWLLISLAVQAVLTGAVLIALPRVITALDFEGYYGMTVAIPVWFVGGMLVGLISPGKTFVEPVTATIVVAVPTAIFLNYTQTVRAMPWFMYAIMAMAGVMFTLVGSYAGERIQLGPPPKPAP